MKTILCTSGTSIAHGTAWNGDASAYRKAIREKLSQPPGGQEFLHWASAEINSLARLELETHDELFLLHSETGDGRVCAEETARLLEKHLGRQAELHQIVGLQVDDAGRFRHEGIQNLFATLDRLHQRYGDSVLNVTGGFKSVVPYMTLYGQLHRIPVVYVFEQSNQLITLPPVPVNYDWERLSQAGDALHWLVQEGVGREQEFFSKIPGVSYEEREWFRSLLEQDGNEVTLSAFGLLLVHALEQQEAQVLLSPKARQDHQASSGKVREQFDHLLDRVGDPIWRHQHRHAFSSELSIFKPGNTSKRMGAFLRGERVYVARLWSSHDQYEREAPAERIVDYPTSKFTPHHGNDT